MGAPSLLVFGCLFSIAVVRAEDAPQYPIWPDQFTAAFDVLVPDYGKDFVKKGVLYYDYASQRARADYFGWCIPLFDGSGGGEQGLYNETCSFLMTPKGAYFISPTFPIKEDRCCYFADIPAPTPDWLKNTRYNTTEVLRGQMCDKWWFAGTSDPNNPYYGYWDRAKDQRPVRFLGLSSIGVTILDYTAYKAGPVPDPSRFDVPPNCQAECQGPSLAAMTRRMLEHKRTHLPLMPLA